MATHLENRRTFLKTESNDKMMELFLSWQKVLESDGNYFVYLRFL